MNGHMISGGERDKTTSECGFAGTWNLGEASLFAIQECGIDWPSFYLSVHVTRENSDSFLKI